MKQRFNVTGMSCSACSRAVEKAVERIDGVEAVSVNLTSGIMLCDYKAGVDEVATSKSIIDAVKKAGFGAEPYAEEAEKAKSTDKGTQKRAKEQKEVAKRLIISAVFLIPLLYITMGHMLSLPFTHAFSEVKSLSTVLLV